MRNITISQWSKAYKKGKWKVDYLAFDLDMRCKCFILVTIFNYWVNH